ncbi:hypothetical protein HK102_006179 [Quaeritorhiza haematococci]|nr:hypothetical protein HK102_006179 [Quaeritorhiza haematococci]
MAAASNQAMVQAVPWRLTLVWHTVGDDAVAVVKMVLEVETPLSFDLEQHNNDLRAAYHAEHNPAQIVLFEIYGYMSVNNLKYGVVTNYNNTWLLRRELSQGELPKLSIPDPVRIGQPGPVTLVAALLFLVLQVREEWLYASPYQTPVVDCTATPAATAAIKYDLSSTISSTISSTRWFDHQFNKVIGHGLTGSVVSVNYTTQFCDIVAKMVDTFNGEEGSIAALSRELEAYRILEQLQGIFVPRIIRSGVLYGWIHMILMEHGQEAFEQGQAITVDTRHQLTAGFRAIHERGCFTGM